MHIIFGNTSICPCKYMKRLYFSLMFSAEIPVFERTHQFRNLILDSKHYTRWKPQACAVLGILDLQFAGWAIISVGSCTLQLWVCQSRIALSRVLGSLEFLVKCLSPLCQESGSNIFYLVLLSIPRLEVLNVQCASCKLHFQRNKLK